jgi:hypothetical protein
VESTFLDWLRNPITFLVVFDKSVLELGYSDEPLIHSFVNQRSVRSVAVRITMLDLGNFENSSFVLQVSNNLFVRVFYILSFVIRNFIQEEPVIIY